MAFTVPPIDYTSRDFTSLMDDFIRLIPFFSEEWTDHSPSDVGIVLLELCAGHFDALHFYVDRMAGESYLPTAIKRESVVLLLKLIGYDLTSAQAATVDLTFTIPAQAGNTTIAAGHRVKTVGNSPVFFETTEELVITTGNTTGVVGAVEGQAQEDDPLGTSNGTAFQRFTLTNTPVLDGTVVIAVDEGSGYEIWTEVDSFVDSGPTDKHYRLQRDADDAVTVFFGDNANGKIPTNLSPVKANYRTGGGTAGNVGAGTITVLVDPVLFLGSPIAATVTNVSQASGGEERQSIEDAKIQGPRQLKALGRAVTLEDYETLSEGFAGVLKARATVDVTTREVTVRVYPVGGGAVSGALLTALTDYLDSVRMATTTVSVESADFVGIRLLMTVTVKDNFLQEDVEEAVTEAVNDYFTPSATSTIINFGQSLFLSDIYRVGDEVDGVDHVDITAFHVQPETTVDFQVWSGDAEFSAITVSADAVDETWTITWTSPTAFTVQGSVSGLQVATGTIDVAYVSDGGEVSFTIASGDDAPVAADVATFRTTPLIGNIAVDDEQFPELETFTLTMVGGA